MNNKSGGPAYPVLDFSKTRAPGLSIRQYYKAAALSVISSEQFMEMSDDTAAWMAGRLADALIAEDEAHELEI